MSNEVDGVRRTFFLIRASVVAEEVQEARAKNWCLEAINVLNRKRELLLKQAREVGETK